MKKLSLLVFMLLCVRMLSAQEYTRAAYIEKYWRVAVAQMHSSGIPASITLAQACLESDNGNSYLAIKGNNHFGIKCHDWEGRSIKIDDDRKGECFRAYDNVMDSYQDHSDFLTGRSRYSKLFDLELTDYEGWAYGLSEAGYATNPKYPQMLISIIEDYDLTRFDTMYGNGDSSSHKAETVRLFSFDEGDGHMKFSLKRASQTENGVSFVIVRQGETLKDIAKAYSLTLRELLRYNDMSRDKSVEHGTVIYISRKKRRAAEGYDRHMLAADETLWGISQKYAVTLKSLYRMNHIDNNTPLEPGMELRLR